MFCSLSSCKSSMRSRNNSRQLFPSGAKVRTFAFTSWYLSCKSQSDIRCIFSPLISGRFVRSESLQHFRRNRDNQHGDSSQSLQRPSPYTSLLYGHVNAAHKCCTSPPSNPAIGRSETPSKHLYMLQLQLHYQSRLPLKDSSCVAPLEMLLV